MRCDWGRPIFFPGGLGLLGTNLDRKTLAAFFPTASENFAAILCFHALAETVRLRALFLTGLPGAFHDYLSGRSAHGP